MSVQGIFGSLNKYIGDIILKILDDVPLCKLIGSTEYDPLAVEDFDTSTVLHKNLFPFAFVPEITADPITVMNVIIDDIAPFNDGAKFGTLTVYFNVLVHDDLCQIANQELRYFSILDRIDTLFNGYIGLGTRKIVLDGANHVRPIAKYSGYSCAYTVSEMNQVRN